MSLQRPTLGLIDCDGVLCDFVGGVLDFAHTKSTLRWTRDDLTHWDFWDDMKDPLNTDLGRQIFKAIGRKGFCENLSPLPGAKEGIKQLVDQGVHIKVLTSPWKDSQTWCAERFEWLRGHFGIPFCDVIQCAHKDNVHGDFLLDDKVSNVTSWMEYQLLHARKPGRGLIWNTSFNNHEFPIGPLRILSWAQLHAYCRGQE